MNLKNSTRKCFFNKKKVLKLNKIFYWNWIKKSIEIEFKKHKAVIQMLMTDGLQSIDYSARVIDWMTVFGRLSLFADESTGSLKVDPQVQNKEFCHCSVSLNAIVVDPQFNQLINQLTAIQSNHQMYSIF